MTDYVWPADLVPAAMSFYLRPHTGRSISPLTRTQKTYELAAPQWVCRMSFRGGHKGRREQAAYGPRLDALIVMLRGGANRVAIHDFRRSKLRGSNNGWSLGNLAAAQNAVQLTATGFAPGALAFLPGDYVGGDARAHIVTGLAPIYADASGQALAPFFPPLAAPIANGAAVFGNPTSWFRLTSDDAGASLTEPDAATMFDLEFLEDI